MNIKQTILVLLAIFFGGFGITILAYSFLMPTQVHTFNFEFSVTEEKIAGLNGDTDAIKFGTVSQGNYAIRFLDLEHSLAYPLKVHISVEGSGVEWMSVSDNDFVLDPNDARRLSFFATIPGEAPVGDYKGIVRIKLRRSFKWTK